MQQEVCTVYKARYSWIFVSNSS